MSNYYTMNQLSLSSICYHYLKIYTDDKYHLLFYKIMIANSDSELLSIILLKNIESTQVYKIINMYYIFIFINIKNNSIKREILIISNLNTNFYLTVRL